MSGKITMSRLCHATPCERDITGPVTRVTLVDRLTANLLRLLGPSVTFLPYVTPMSRPCHGAWWRVTFHRDTPPSLRGGVTCHARTSHPAREV